ncbi:MAG: ATPase [Alphaproteobacteria bacterium]|nr:ATPase [Alphaproteobacteria bacterium]
MKRFYSTAQIAETDGGFAVKLDGRPVKTPAGKPLTLPTAALAQGVADEWNAQGETVGDEIDPATMPLMRLCGTAIDRIADLRGGLLEGLQRYVDTDLLCYRAGHPQDLVEKQDRVWQPLLDWAAEALGLRMRVVEGVLPIEQDAAAHDAVRAALHDLDDWRLTALGDLVGISGSIVIGLAILRDRLDAEGAFEACMLDELHQAERWGDDHEAVERRKHIRADIASTARFFELLKTS